MVYTPTSKINLILKPRPSTISNVTFILQFRLKHHFRFVKSVQLETMSQSLPMTTLLTNDPDFGGRRLAETLLPSLRFWPIVGRSSALLYIGEKVWFRFWVIRVIFGPTAIPHRSEERLVVNRLYVSKWMAWWWKPFESYLNVSSSTLKPSLLLFVFPIKIVPLVPEDVSLNSPLTPETCLTLDESPMNKPPLTSAWWIWSRFKSRLFWSRLIGTGLRGTYERSWKSVSGTFWNLSSIFFWFLE